LAHTSGLSRRQADEAIEQGRVTINGSTASLGAEVQPNDIVTLDDRVVSKPTDYLYVLYNKPAGLVCSRRQQGDADTIYNQIPEEYQKLKTVGRLDKDSSGILLLTDNGDLAHEPTRPKFAKEKIYIVELD